jgi:hypothetical protein
MEISFGSVHVREREMLPGALNSYLHPKLCYVSVVKRAAGLYNYALQFGIPLVTLDSDLSLR